MIAALAAFLSGRTARERRLLLALVLLGLPLAFAALVALPLVEARTAARADLAAAEAGRDWYAARQAEIAALPAGPVIPAAAAPAGLGQIEAALVEAGLRDALDRLAAAPAGGVELVLTDVAFDAVMPWIDGLEQTLGWRVATLALVRRAAGRVDVQLGLVP